MTGVKIGKYDIGRVWLAPMAGYTDIAFRTLAREHGAAHTVTEMVSVRGIVHGSAATVGLMETAECERPSCVQFFGSAPDDFAYAAERAECDIIDINMACPMPKIVKNGDGAALLKTPELAGKIVAAIVNACDKPVTVKTRLGYKCGEKTAAELVAAVSEAGAAAVTVHGRYAEQRYAGECDVAAVEELKRSASVPVILSGDVTRENLADRLDRFDAVMIGRAALGDIGVFIGEKVDPFAAARRYMELLTAHFDDRYSVNQARKLFVHMFKGIKGGRALRTAVNEAGSVAEVLAALDNAARLG